ncbi:MAG: hypothetical protein KDB26_03915, partial [Microthrixaceae bacterium]|nr:hypothetical protein [Microthrixaceae bacterium]
YQGLTPVIPRLGIEAVTDSLDGRLTGVSMLIAQSIMISYLVAAAWRARRSMCGLSEVRPVEQVLIAFSIFGIASGLVGFIASRAWVYHEAIAWGVAMSVASLVHLEILIDWIRRGHQREAPVRPMLHASLSTLFAGLAFNSRSSVGLGPLAALGATSVLLGLLAISNTKAMRGNETRLLSASRWLLVSTGFERDQSADSDRNSSRLVVNRYPRLLVSLIVVVVVGSGVLVGAYTAVNYARFGSLFGVPLEKQLLVDTDPVRLKALEANNGSLFGLSYTPSVALQLLRPDALAPRSVFPYVGFPTHRPAVLGSPLFAERDWSSSIPNSSPIAFFAGIAGLVVLGLPRRVLRGRSHDDSGGQSDRDRVAAWRLPIVGAFLSGAPVLIFGYMAQRYTIDFYPFLALSGTIGITWLISVVLSRGGHSPSGESSERIKRRPGAARACLAMLIVLASVLSVWNTYALALQYQREIAPGFVSVNRSGWLSTQLRLPGSVDYWRVQTPSDLPEGNRVGELVVVGRCNALYRWSSHNWLLLESGGPGDAHPDEDGAPARDAAGLRVKVTAKYPIEQLTTPVVLLERDNGSERETIELVRVRGGVVLRASFDPAKGEVIEMDDGANTFTADLDVTEDPRVGELLIRPHGVQRSLLTAYGLTSPAISAWRVPNQPQGVTITAKDLPTPLCDEVLGQ